MLLAFLSASLPLIFWWRFKDTPIDRDYCPYAYPAVFKSGFLENGHVDIKGPLLHWSYKLWLGIVSRLNLPLNQKLRLLPAICTSIAVGVISFQLKPETGLILAVLLCSPTLWVHMANTEWLTVSVIAFSVAESTNQAPICQASVWLALGLLPWINQKNLLLIVPVAWALGLNLTPTIPNALAIAAPSIAIAIYLVLTGKLSLWRYWLISIPASMGKKRTFQRNTVSASKLLIPCLALFAPIVASMNSITPWAIVACVVVLLMIASKQVVPHHFILLTLPMALATQPTMFTFAGIAIIWLFRDGITWYRPDLIYRVTFGSAQGDYGTVMKDADTLEAWIRKNTKPDEVIWVNGMENQIYLNTLRKAWRIEIPELMGVPEGEKPRVIVHCSQSAKEFDYEGYEPELISRIGLFTLMVKA